eukprot:TRINITY_DN70875_c0_g1_i1.p1 TRINITY_DN70875_c0_g1~~TRINITY_DN70875_c0_g1_i1.p1  ORF type:complete len:168 (+),score=13.97 TRINITY_DN70875_c0_g1_i1:86-589(+)
MVRIKHRWFLCEMVFPDLYSIHEEEDNTALIVESNATAFGRVKEKKKAIANKVEEITEGHLTQAVRRRMERTFGTYAKGSLAGGFRVKYFNNESGLFIVKTPREQSVMVRNAITLTTRVHAIPCILRCFHVGGSIEQCKKVALEYDQKSLTKKANLKRLREANVTRR